VRARWLAWSWLRLRYAASAERCANPDPEIAAIPIGPKRLSRHRGPPPCREPEQQDGDAEHQVRQLGPRAGPGCAQDQDLAHDPAEQDRVGCDEGGDRPRRHERDDGRGRGAAADQDRKDRSWSEVADERCSVQKAGREAISLQPGDERDATADGRQGDEPVQSHQSDAPWGPGWPRPAPCRAERAGGAASSSSSQRRWSRPPAATRSSSTLPRTGRSIASAGALAGSQRPARHHLPGAPASPQDVSPRRAAIGGVLGITSWALICPATVGGAPTLVYLSHHYMARGRREPARRLRGGSQGLRRSERHPGRSRDPGASAP
jgi:hypothetical protein